MGKQKEGVSAWPGALQDQGKAYKLRNSAPGESKKHGAGISTEGLRKPQNPKRLDIIHSLRGQSKKNEESLWIYGIPLKEEICKLLESQKEKRGRKEEKAYLKE